MSSSALKAAVTDFDRLPIPAGIVELDGTILHVNEAGTKLLGRPEDQLAGRKAWAFAPGAEYIWEGLVQIVRDQGEARNEITVATPKGPRKIQYLVVMRHHEDRPLLLMFALEQAAAP
ncbi:MAG TPA: PAS domain-containing protein [Kofleriaceae bacterium]|nr:PAS domain-containing protein [Kofleriaceae bacterium]